MRKTLITFAGAAFLWGVAGCGENPSLTVYKQGQYQGKPDKQPWDNDQFKGDKVAWESVVKARNQGQDEYVRIAQ